jgi:membrane carboxypeptidase/penicillin-binding protein PbpC
MLSDNRARCAAFGCPNVLEIGRPAAVKTGTTNDIRDNWTIGYTPELLTGVWVGNPNRESMRNISGVTGAGPIWHNFMQQALANTPISDFARPPGIVEMEICAISGAQPSPYCPEKRREIFAADRPAPGPEHDWFQLVRIDAGSGLLYVDGCAGSVIEKVMVIVPDEGRQWAQEHGYEVAPKDNCTTAPTTTVVTISDPANLKQVTGIVPIIGTVQMSNFEHYELQFGSGAAPGEWRWISGPHLAQVADGQLTTWDTNGLEPGEYTLRLSAFAQGGGVVEARASVIVDHGATPTPTATPGPTATPTITPSETPLLLPTLPPSTSTPEPTAFAPDPSVTPTPSEIIAPTLELPTLQLTPTATPTIA